MTRCQAELHNDVTNLEKQEVEHNVDIEYRRVHKLYLSFLGPNAKMNWCKEGDENTHLFHQSIKARRVENIIYAINDNAENGHDDPKKVSEDFLEYYHELLGIVMLNRVRVKRG